MAIDKTEFRTALGRFASGVTVVTTRDAEQRPHGITVSAFCSLSLEPPLVLICIDNKAGILRAFDESGAFAVNVLTENQEQTSRRFASREPNKFEGIAYCKGIEGVPVLEGSLANLECRIKHRYEGGDHTIIVGEIEATKVHDAQPLLYFRGGYARLTI